MSTIDFGPLHSVLGETQNTEDPIVKRLVKGFNWMVKSNKETLEKSYEYLVFRDEFCDPVTGTWLKNPQRLSCGHFVDLETALNLYGQKRKCPETICRKVVFNYAKDDFIKKVADAFHVVFPHAKKREIDLEFMRFKLEWPIVQLNPMLVAASPYAKISRSQFQDESTWVLECQWDNKTLYVEDDIQRTNRPMEVHLLKTPGKENAYQIFLKDPYYFDPATPKYRGGPESTAVNNEELKHSTVFYAINLEGYAEKGVTFEFFVICQQDCEWARSRGSVTFK